MISRDDLPAWAASFCELIEELLNGAEENERGDKNKKANYFILLGNIFKQIGDCENAIKYYLKAEEVILSQKRTSLSKADYIKLLENLSHAYLKIGDPDKALEYAKKMLSLDKDNDHAKKIVALIRRKTGNKRKTQIPSI